MLLNRRTLLWVLLGALALAAASGMLAIVAPIAGVWRFAAMSVIGAVTAGIMMSIASWTEKPETRAGGLLGMGVCVALFVGGCGLVWETVIGRQLFELIGVAMVASACAGFPAAHFLKRFWRDGWRWASIVGVGGAACVFLIAIAGGLMDFVGLPISSSRIYGSAATIGLGVVCAAFALVGYRTPNDQGRTQPDSAPWRWLAIPGAVLGVGSSLWGIWFGGGDREWVPTLGYALAAVVAHGVLIGRSRAGQAYPWLRWLTFGAAVLTGVLVVSAVWVNVDDYTVLWRMVTGSGILTGSGTLAILVMDRLAFGKRLELRSVVANRGPGSAPTSISSIRIECPRCSLAQTIPVGEEGALCAGCKLHVAVRTHAALCGACGYDLKDLKGGTCPECGAAIG